MKLDERLEALMAILPYANKTGGVKAFQQELRLALLHTARDQRHACAGAIARMGSANVRKADAHQAVMNADLES